MRKLNILLLVALALLTACHEPDYISPTADRQGLTSLTAIFTSGPFVNQEMGKLSIGEEMGDKLVIPIPWFYPETSDDETTQYMSNVRVQAELQENCFIEPALTVLDLTKENYFTYTNAQGDKKKICITGERVKSNKCEMLGFSIQNPAISGIVDKANKKISIISVDNLSSCLATAQISTHATISPDPSTLRSYEEPVEFTVTAHDGTTSEKYTVVKETPEKIASGFSKESLEKLFNFDPVATLGLPSYSKYAAPSMASLGGNLVVCLGNGATPIYLNQITGAKLGEINLGSAVACSVTSDESENMLIVNQANGSETVKIYRTSSVKQAPELFYSFKNETSLPMGYKMKVIGSIGGDAIIVLPNVGIDGATASSQFTCVTVKNGTPVGTNVVDLSSQGISWGSAPVNMGGIVAASTNISDGFIESHYPSSSKFYWIKGDGSIGASLDDDSSGWGLNANNLDSKRFNNVNYVALLVGSHFPHWGMGPQLYLFNINDKTQLTGGNVWSCPALAFSNNNIEWYQQANAGYASGDVLIAPSKDGFKLYIYYYDHNSGVVGGYSADCIKR